MLLLLFDKAWSRRRYQQMCPEEQYKLVVFQNLRLLALLGLEREDWETLQELCVRCRFQYGRETDRDVLPSLHFIDHYESVVYGGRSASEKMIEEAVGEAQVLLEVAKTGKAVDICPLESADVDESVSIKDRQKSKVTFACPCLMKIISDQNSFPGKRGMPAMPGFKSSSVGI